MGKKTCSLLIALLTVIMLIVSANADDKPIHDYAFEYVFFGNGEFKESRPKVKDAIGLIEYAAQLAIDQYAGNSSTYLAFLQKGGYNKGKYKIKGLPQSISEINCVARPNNHRNYTHMGWFCKRKTDFYNIDVNKNKEWPQIWEKRKNIICGAVDSIFDFHRLVSGSIIGIDFGYDSKCDSFSALVYYVHILQDYCHDTPQNIINNGHKIPFARIDCNDTSHTLISEILYHTRRLFTRQKGSYYEYDILQRELIDLNNRTYYLIRSDGTVSENDFSEFHKRVEELKEILHDRLPGLLKKEQFFADVFG